MTVFIIAVIVLAAAAFLRVSWALLGRSRKDNP